MLLELIISILQMYLNLLLNLLHLLLLALQMAKDFVLVALKADVVLNGTILAYKIKEILNNSVSSAIAKKIRPTNLQ
jgi:hypothetical protein